MKMAKYIGLMSGTSLDGADTVLVETDGQQVTLIAADFLPMPEILKQSILDVCHGQATTLVNIGQLDHRLGLFFAEAVQQLLIKHHILAADVDAIGCHGQTVYHDPDGIYPFSLQLGDANIIAARTGITTITDFRRRDLALGGQGAPLVPAFHAALFGTSASRAILNIGGIANITLLSPHHHITGFDTGPGNVLLDAWVRLQTGNPFDNNAEFAKQGQICTELLHVLFTEPFFTLQPPKSTGRELFNLTWLQQKLNQFPTLSAVDIQATLVELTAISITRSLNSQNEIFSELLVCGGGVHNPLLMQRLADHLPHTHVLSTEHYGVNPDYMEAMAFAWLGWCAIHKQHGNLPAVTGAEHSAVLGAIYSR
ncbi:MAG: anhydro-N-acetylmuramic acid kinase [Plesiomonas sp.]|uniref:anhydro-N-acetylmuramic acid kinase n=1 Tax=Plesiomonas sp. TaxID=2486279 RepID=UPI003F37C762